MPPDPDTYPALVALDGWTTSGARITDPEVLDRLRVVLTEESHVIVEHGHYRGAKSPSYRVFEDFEELEEYLRDHVHPGDKISCWHFGRCCRDDNMLASGKRPDAQGRVPTGGAY